MTFGEAIEELKKGNLVTRQGWNGKGMFIFQRPADELKLDFVVSTVKSLPQKVKDYYANTFSGYAPFAGQEPTVEFTAYLCMKAADGSIVNGWLASQTDMLAEDWQEFTY